jgi:hypothetical protein
LVSSSRSSASRQRPLCTRSLNSGILLPVYNRERGERGGRGGEVQERREEGAEQRQEHRGCQHVVAWGEEDDVRAGSWVCRPNNTAVPVRLDTNKILSSPNCAPTVCGDSPRGHPELVWWQKGVPHSMQRAAWVCSWSARASVGAFSMTSSQSRMRSPTGR